MTTNAKNPNGVIGESTSFLSVYRASLDGVIYAGGYGKPKRQMTDVAANYRKIIDRISEAAAKCGRNAREIRLLAAAKTQTVEAIGAAVDAGVRLIGENYVQEAKSKREEVSRQVEWHMVGHLQRNKAKTSVGLFDVIETLDNTTLARELDKEGRKQNIRVRALIEVNLGGEASKSGTTKNKVSELLKAVGELSYVSIEGLMTIPPASEDCEEARPYFRELRELRDELQGLRLPNVDLKELSMGMTHDYPIAIEEGATIVRIGTALFGPRRT
ncbi:MAG: YggS family pyridoxal phosphate-dependent enzyme [Candidatus Binatia bacterium]